MFPAIEITESFAIPTYGLVFMTGYALALLFAVRCAYLYCIDKWDVVYAMIYGLFGIGIGAKVMYFLTKLPRIILHFDLYKLLWKTDIDAALGYLFGGLTFYGGLIGAILGMYVYCRKYKVDGDNMAKVLAPYIPFAHMFGRIGCFLSGCCYGIPYSGIFAVRFPYDETNPVLSEVSRFPVQLLEAGGNFVLFLVLLAVRKKSRPGGKSLLALYFVMYGVLRIFTEMLRDDPDRGRYGFFSTSQVISIAVIIYGIVCLAGSAKRSSTASNP